MYHAFGTHHWVMNGDKKTVGFESTFVWRKERGAFKIKILVLPDSSAGWGDFCWLLNCDTCLRGGCNVLPDTTEAQLWNLHKTEETEAVSLAVFGKDVWENLLH